MFWCVFNKYNMQKFRSVLIIILTPYKGIIYDNSGRKLRDCLAKYYSCIITIIVTIVVND